MDEDESNAGPVEKAPARQTLRISLASLNQLLRKAKIETRRAQAHESWLRSVRNERLRADEKAREPRGDE